MKYIIDIPDKGYVLQTVYDEEGNYTGTLAYGKSCIPYTEPDRKAIEDEVWHLARTIESMSVGEIMNIFGVREENVPFLCNTLKYQEAKSKFEAWLKQKDEIHVGDEVKDHEDIKAVVLDICMDGEAYTVYTENRICEDWLKDEGFVKTGRHFNEVEEVLKKMRGEEE